MKRDGIASWTILIQSENKISKNSQLEGKVNKIIWTFYSTVEPCFNEPSYNKVLGIINNIPSPSTIIVKYMEKKLYMAKPDYGQHIYCQSLDPSLYLRFHCNIVYMMYMYHVSLCWHKYIFSQLVTQ